MCENFCYGNWQLHGKLGIAADSGWNRLYRLPVPMGNILVLIEWFNLADMVDCQTLHLRVGSLRRRLALGRKMAPAVPKKIIRSRLIRGILFYRSAY